MEGLKDYITAKMTDLWLKYKPYGIGFAVGLLAGWLL